MEQKNRTSELLNVDLDAIVLEGISKTNKKKRQIKILSVILIGILFSVMAIIVACLTVIPNNIYSKAKDLTNSKLYDEALKQYNTYIRYKNFLLDNVHIDEELLCKISTIQTEDDFNQQIKEVKYLRALSYLENEKYDIAIAEFDALEDYSDSEIKSLETKYLRALAYLENGKYDTAITEFDALGDYNDSQNKSQECWYQKGLLALDTKEYHQAIDILKRLNGYRDSDEKIDFCENELYNIAVSFMNDGDYEYAISEFRTLNHYKDSDALIVECATIIATNYERNGDYKNAILWYSSINNTEKVNDVMYNYVKSNMNREDTLTYDYLCQLKSKNYRDSENIYSSLYKFKIKLSFNNYKLCYVITGGPPKGEVTVRILNEARWSNGSRSTHEIVEDYTFTSPAEYEGIEQKRDVILLYANRHTITAFDGVSGAQLAQIVDTYD